MSSAVLDALEKAACQAHITVLNAGEGPPVYLYSKSSSRDGEYPCVALKRLSRPARVYLESTLALKSGKCTYLF